MFGAVGPLPGTPPEDEAIAPLKGDVEAGLVDTEVTPRRSAADLAQEPGYGPDIVIEVQRDLRRLGYDPGRSDGRIGPQTEAAIAAFEADHGLAADGAIDRELLATLEAVSGDGPPVPGEVVAALPAARQPAGVGELDARELFKAASPSVYVLWAFRSLEDLRAARPVGLGSAVAVDRARALTNCHVLEGGSIAVLTQNGTSLWLVEPTADSDLSADCCWVQVVKGGHAAAACPWDQALRRA